MSFMQPQIDHNTWIEIEDRTGYGGTEWIPLDCYDGTPNDDDSFLLPWKL